MQKTLFRVQLSLVQKFAIFIVLSVAFLVITLWVRATLESVGPAGYAVAFLISAAGSATVVIPAPAFAVVVVLTEDLNLWLLGLLSGIGGTVGELSGYWLGTQCRVSINRTRMERVLSRGMSRYGGGVIFAAALLPAVPVDVAGLIAGSTSYPVKRFVFWLALGKIPMTIVLLYLTVKAFNAAGPYLRWMT